MLAEQRAVRPEEQHGAVERAAVALDDADDEVDGVSRAIAPSASTAGPGTSIALS